METKPGERDQEHALAEAVAAAFDARLSIRLRSQRYAAQAWRPEMAGWPTLQLDDVSGIPFLQDIVGVEFYQLRAFVRARTGDVVAATCPDDPAYRAYNRDVLGLGEAAFVQATEAPSPIEVAAGCARGAAFGALVEFARGAGRLVIHPYMGIEAVWALAEALSEASGVEVGVLGPPPPVCWLTNDKVHLYDVAAALCGLEATVPAFASADPEELALRLLQLSHGRPRVALKLARCASAMGNGLFDAASLHGRPFPALCEDVRAFLDRKAWRPGEHVQAVAWEDVALSPSSQTWLPGAGAPRLDGLYEQLLEGDARVFLGSIPARLDPDVAARMTRWSLRLGACFQALGYVGRCSFDFILTAPTSAAPSALRFVECNGRWGGTSTPMHLLDRLFPQGRPSYRARDVIAPALIGQPLTTLLDRLGDTLWDASTGRGRFIVYNVGALTRHGKFDVIALGDSIEDATEALEGALVERLR